MARKKLRRFAELETLSNVFRRERAVPCGAWARQYFGNEHPLVLELGCGKGEYSIELARLQPERNIVGIDRKGERIWVGAKLAIEKQLPNVAFLQINVEELTQHFEPGQVEEIWIPFPDPLPKRKQAKHRLTSPQKLDLYRVILRDHGIIHLKTDDRGLFEYTLTVLRRKGVPILDARCDLYAGPGLPSVPDVRTTYERRHLAAGRLIKSVRFELAGGQDNDR